MAALTLTLLLAATIDLEVRGCGAAIDDAALRRLVALEWQDPPAGTSATVSCDANAQWRLKFEAPGLLDSEEELELPALSSPARTRVLALIIAERGRAFTNAPPASPPLPEVPPPLVESARPPLVLAKPEDPVGGVRVAAPQRGAPLREALVNFGASERSRRWRLSIAGVAVRPTSLQPWRFGPEVKVYAGPFALALSSTIGTVTAELGTVTALALTAEPEVTVVCLGGARWRACAVARGIAGYGTIFARSQVSEVIAMRQDGPLLGGAGVIAGSLELLDWLALDADVRFGGAWGVYGSQSGVPIATVGGGLFAASLALVASWGSP